jgi:DNA topoisomerase-3
VEFDWKKGRQFEKENIEDIREKLEKAYLANNGSLKILDIKTRKQNKLRPLPLNTVEFTKLASKKLKIDSYSSMLLAERLYNNGYISYPRTETQIYSDTQDLNEILGNILYKIPNLNINSDIDENENKNKNENKKENKNEIENENKNKIPFDEDDLINYNWLNYAKNLYDSKKELKTRIGKLNDNSHPPISPLKLPEEGKLKSDEIKIFNLICRSFLASVSEDAISLHTTVLMKVCDEEEFTATGYSIERKGFLEVYPYEELGDKIIPKFEIGEEIKYIDNKDININDIINNKRKSKTNDKSSDNNNDKEKNEENENENNDDNENDDENDIDNYNDNDIYNGFRIIEGKTKPPSNMSESELIDLMHKNGIGTDATIHEHIKNIKNKY